MTNPPYSGDHVEKILNFCVDSGKPWFLLVPNFVYVNDYYTSSLAVSDPPSRPFFLAPKIRYNYLVPSGVRRESEVKTSPFTSLWFVDLRASSAGFIKSWRDAVRSQPSEATRFWPTLAGHRSQLPHESRAQYDPTRRRLRKKQREAAARRARAAEASRVAMKKAIPCRFGSACFREGCWYSH